MLENEKRGYELAGNARSKGALTHDVCRRLLLMLPPIHTTAKKSLHPPPPPSMTRNNLESNITQTQIDTEISLAFVQSSSAMQFVLSLASF